MTTITAEAAGIRPGCFSAADIEAEQAIHFQAQLMVVSDICRDSTYGEFAQRNRDAIIAYQRQMIDHFRRAGERRADVTFENYMTRLANQASLSSSHQSVDVCRPSEGLIAVANSLGSSSEFRRYIAAQAAANRARYMTCQE